VDTCTLDGNRPLAKRRAADTVAAGPAEPQQRLKLRVAPVAGGAFRAQGGRRSAQPALECFETGAQRNAKDAGAMKQKFTASVWQEGEWFVAQCLEVDVASQGASEQEALANLREALELHFEPPTATVAPRLHTIEIELHAA
jgi:hypothetical protein